MFYSQATPLFDGGLDLDSIGFLELILVIEKTLGVGLRSEDLNGDALTTVNGLVRHVGAVLSRMPRGTNETYKSPSTTC